MAYKASKPAKRSIVPIRLRAVALILVLLIVGATLVVRHQYNRNLHPVSSSHSIKYVTIATGSSVNQIADALYQRGLIRSKSAFEWYVSSHEDRDKLQAGTYGFTPSQSTPQIIQALVEGKIATNLVTILPGQNIIQVRHAFIKAGFKAKDVDRALQASQYRSAYPALADNPATANLEGFLYPDSYQKTANTNPKIIVGEALDEMQKHLTVDIKNRFAKQGLTPYQGVALASIIEEEVATPEDRSQVAQVFLRRLKIGMTLDSDATARYGAVLDGQPPSVTYSSIYNTYMHKGLPPGPISAVSEESLKAVANPASTDWVYFVNGDDGATHFSKTLEEQKANTAKYCHKLCQM